MARRRDPEILIEVLADRLLAVQTELLLAVLKPVVYAPHIEGDMLA